MKITILAWLNIFISIAAATYFYVMLPIVYGMIHSLDKQRGIPFEPLSILEYISTTIIPIGIGLVLILSARKLKAKSEKASIVLLSVYPFVVLVCIAKIAYEIFKAP